MQMKMYHNEKWEDRIPIQQSQGAGSRNDMSDNKHNYVTGSDAPKNMIMKSSQDSMKSKLRTRSGQINQDYKG